MTAAIRVWWALRGRADRESRTPVILSLVAFAVATSAVLVCAAGLQAFRARADLGTGGPSADVYASLAWQACALMVVPVLTLGGVAARLAARRRDRRLATLRLTGATTPQVVIMTLAETGSQALAGGIAGVLLYVALLPGLASITFQDIPFSVGDLWVGPAGVLLAVVAVTLLAVTSGLVGLVQVVIGPLGVTARTTPGRLSLLRVGIVGCGVVAWFAVSSVRHQLGPALVIAVFVGLVATINLVGPYVVMLFGYLLTKVARSAPTLLAARRLVDDPRSTWRAVGAIGLGIVVAGLSTYFAGLPVSSDIPGEATLVRDIGTGSMLTLSIISVVAATSTGVVQAARVLDHVGQYQALSLAGAEESTLHAARNREVAIPLAATVILSGGMTLALLVPYASVIGPTLIVRFLLAVATAFALMVLAVAVSRPLVRQASAPQPASAAL